MSNRPNRRQFLRQTAAFGLTAGLLPTYAAMNADDTPPPWEMAIPLGMRLSPGRHFIPYSAMNPNDLGERNIRYDTTGMRQISPAPPPGVHPRMLQSPEDREPMRKLYRDTPHGHTMWRMLIGYTDKMKGKLGGDKKAYPHHPNGEMLTTYQRGGLTEPADTYRKVLAGDLKGFDIEKEGSLLGLMALEAYRCWIEDDAAGGKELCVAIENIADHLKDRVKPNERGDMPPRTSEKAIGSHNMGFCYDYAYNFMTGPQRDKVRRLIATVSHNKAHYGSFLAPEATVSNWCTLQSFQALTLMAIEGEEGFNEHYWKGLVRAYHNFLTYGWCANGAPQEGLGKNHIFATTLVLFAKRGIDLHGHPHVRAFGEKFLPAVSLPNGRGFIGCDDWGGTGTDQVLGNYRFHAEDAIGLKWLFPDSKPIDHVWRIYTGENYEAFTDFRQEAYYMCALMAILFPSGPVNKELDARKSEVATSYFDPERGYFASRSDLTPDAIHLTLHCRQMPGGHTTADRNHFNFSSHGRLWGLSLTLSGGSHLGSMHESRFHSTVLIDDVGQVDAVSKNMTTPGRMVDVHDGPDLSYACGDAKYAYDWTWDGAGPWLNADGTLTDGEPGVEPAKLAKGWSKVMETPNDFMVEKLPYTYMDRPFYLQPHWLQPGKLAHRIKKPFNPVQKAFRTAALIRGKYPYALVIDDIQKDAGKHDYKWLMQAASDLEIVEYVFDESGKSDIYDLILCGREVADVKRPPEGAPMLLVRILQLNNDATRRRYSTIGHLEQYMQNVRWPNKGSGKRLVIPSYSITPDYKIMLYPHRHGEELPVARWLDRDKTTLSIRWRDTEDRFAFSVDEQGRTRFTLKRSGQE